VIKGKGNVLVDTAVWSLALRRKPHQLNEHETLLVDELTALGREGRARIIGLVRQEVLSGIKTQREFDKLRQKLSTLRDEPVDTQDHEAAAEAGNKCRTRGIAVSTVDILICAVAQRRGMPIFTTDPDFSRYARVLALTLHAARGEHRRIQ
jgi:predicted nucleic acid-binding protein